MIRFRRFSILVFRNPWTTYTVELRSRLPISSIHFCKYTVQNLEPHINMNANMNLHLICRGYALLKVFFICAHWTRTFEPDQQLKFYCVDKNSVGIWEKIAVLLKVPRAPVIRHNHVQHAACTMMPKIQTTVARYEHLTLKWWQVLILSKYLKCLCQSLCMLYSMLLPIPFHVSVAVQL